MCFRVIFNPIYSQKRDEQDVCSVLKANTKQLPQFLNCFASRLAILSHILKLWQKKSNGTKDDDEAVQYKTNTSNQNIL